MAQVPSFPVAPPSTVVGFLGSLCGQFPKDMHKAVGASEFAYGWLRRPAGRGIVMFKDHVNASFQGPLKEAMARLTKKKNGESTRPVLREIFYDMDYRIVVRGPYAERVQQALEHDERRGILYLGGSTDIVHTVDAECDGSSEWVVPVDGLIGFRLPVNTGRGASTISAQYRVFRFNPATPEIPDKAWMSLSAAF
jgi:hypothetical protein